LTTTLCPFDNIANIFPFHDHTGMPEIKKSKGYWYKLKSTKYSKGQLPKLPLGMPEINFYLVSAKEKLTEKSHATPRFSSL